MFEITPLPITPRQATVQTYRATEPDARRPAPRDVLTRDRVELSEDARSSAGALETDQFAAERIDELRREIAADTYLTPEKLEHVIDRLHAELFDAVPTPS